MCVMALIHSSAGRSHVYMCKQSHAERASHLPQEVDVIYNLFVFIQQKIKDFFFVCEEAFFCLLEGISSSSNFICFEGVGLLSC